MISPLEKQLKAHPEIALINQAASGIGRTDQTELRIGITVVGVGKVRRVRKVKRLGPELHVQPLRELETAKDAEIHISESWPAKGIVAGRPKCRSGDGSKG